MATRTILFTGVILVRNLRKIAITQVTGTRQDDECNHLLSTTIISFGHAVEINFIATLMNRKNYREWQQDIDARQRNIVFPDTAANEARFWRNLISGRWHLTVTQRVGLALLCFGLAISAFIPVFWGHKIYGSWARAFESAGIDWFLGAAFLGVFLLLFNWSLRRK